MLPPPGLLPCRRWMWQAGYVQARPTALRFDIDPAPPGRDSDGPGRLRAITAVSGWDGDVVDEVLWARPLGADSDGYGPVPLARAEL